MTQLTASVFFFSLKNPMSILGRHPGHKTLSLWWLSWLLRCPLVGAVPTVRRVCEGFPGCSTASLWLGFVQVPHGVSQRHSYTPTLSVDWAGCWRRCSSVAHEGHRRLHHRPPLKQFIMVVSTSCVRFHHNTVASRQMRRQMTLTVKSSVWTKYDRVGLVELLETDLFKLTFFFLFIFASQLQRLEGSAALSLFIVLLVCDLFDSHIFNSPIREMRANR